MNEKPERLLVAPDALDRLAALVAALDDEEQVRLTLDDGSMLEVRPSVQLFRADDGGYGSNALLRLEPLAGDAPPRYLWLDRVAQVMRLGSD